jgi:hypothetical protein
VLSEEDLTIVYEARDSKLALIACKHSPIGDLYALTSIDGMIYVYKTSDFSIKAICKGHTGIYICIYVCVCIYLYIYIYINIYIRI